MNKEVLIIILLLIILTYMVIRDIIVKNKRRENRVLLKRVSRKFDNLNKEAKRQSGLFTQLLNILSDEESQ